MASHPHLLEASDSNFENAITQSPGLALVDFWAEWCGPCKPLALTLDSLAAEYAGKVKIFALNVENNPESAVKYRVRGLPTVLFFKNGQLVDEYPGNQARDTLAQAIEKHLA